MVQEIEVANERITEAFPPELRPKPPVRMSFEDFLTSDIEGHAEWFDGEVILMTPPNTRHQQLLMFLSALLRYYAEVHELGTVLPAPFLMRIGANSPGREPDILFIAREHLDRLTPKMLDGAADLIIEIISPESRKRDRQQKFREYEQGGVREYWLIDPTRNQAAFYRLNTEGIYQLVPLDDGIFRSEVLTGFWLRVEWLWREPLPTLVSVLREWKLI